MDDPINTRHASATPGDAAGSHDDTTIVPRLQSAVARVLPAIEATVATLAAGAMQPRQMEQAARALASLTRTLRELNGLLSQHQIAARDKPRDLDALRASLARKLEALIESDTGDADATGVASEGEKK